MPSASAQSCTLLRVAKRASRIKTPSFFVRIVICDFVSMNPLERLICKMESNDLRRLNFKVRSHGHAPHTCPGGRCQGRLLTPHYSDYSRGYEILSPLSRIRSTCRHENFTTKFETCRFQARAKDRSNPCCF